MDILINCLNFIISFGSIIIALLALIQTYNQIKLLNKHELFEKRLNCFYSLRGLIDNYKNVERYILIDEDSDKNNKYDKILLLLTLNNVLRGINDVIDDLCKAENQVKIYGIIEGVSRIKYEMNFIFPKKIRDKIVIFIDAYINVISSVIKMKIAAIFSNNDSYKTFYQKINRLDIFKDYESNDESVKRELDILKGSYNAIIENRIEIKIAMLMKI